MFEEIINDFKDLKRNYQDVQDKLEIVKEEAEKAKIVGQEIQRSVNEFKVTSQPRIDKIKTILEKYQPEESSANTEK